MHRIVKYVSIPALISLIILYLCCFIPVDDIPDFTFDFFVAKDKIIHYLMYFGLSGATAINYLWGEKGYIRTSKLIIGAFILPIIYGGVIEILQYYYFPSRTGDWWDFLADMLGSLSTIPLVIWFKNYLRS